MIGYMPLSARRFAAVVSFVAILHLFDRGTERTGRAVIAIHNLSERVWESQHQDWQAKPS